MNRLIALKKADANISEYVSVHHPTLGEIAEYGEEEYFSLVSTLTATPSDMKSVLFDSGIDYEAMTDFDLFTILIRAITPEKSKILLGELDLSVLHTFVDTRIDETILCTVDEKGNPLKIVIDQLIYELLVDELRKTHQLKKNIEKAYNQYTKQILIDEDRERRNTTSEFKSILEPLIVAGVCCADIPYNFTSVWSLQVGIFLRGISQIQKYNNIQHLISGIYAGNVDAKKINKSELSWI